MTDIEIQEANDLFSDIEDDAEKAQRDIPPEQKRVFLQSVIKTASELQEKLK